MADDDREVEAEVDLDELAGRSGGDEGQRLAKYWLEQVKKYDTEMKRWRKRSIAIERRYRDERNRTDEEGQKRANYLWANTETLYPAIYGKCPTAIVERRFKDRDPVGRTAATILERAVRNDMEMDGFHDALGDSVLDYLLAGRGTTWVRFEPEFGPGISIPVHSKNDLRDEQGQIEDEDDTAGEEKLEETDEVLVRESAPVDYINWDDFGFLPAKARRWAEVRVVFKRVAQSRDEMVGRWGDEIGGAIPLQRSEKERRDNSGSGQATRDDRDDKAEVFELWDKDTMSVYWVATGYDHLCNKADDPLSLPGFFPTPKPLTMTRTTSTMIPVPLFVQYQDQAKQIDELTQRISQLIKSIKAAGVYNGACEPLMRLLDESVENELIPVDRWTKHMSDKGLAGQVDLLPIEDQIKAVEVLIAQKEKVVAEMDRLTGLTDIMRGVTVDGRETLGASKLKNSNGKTRLRQHQDIVQEFARDTLKLKAQVIAKHFRKKTLVKMSGALYDEGFGFSDIEDFLSGQGDGQDLAPPIQPAAPPMLAPPGAAGLPAPAGAGPMPRPPMRPPAQPAAPVQGMEMPPIVKAVLKINRALDLLRSDCERGFRIDIETDSTIVADEQQDRADRIEFTGMVEKYLQTAQQIAVANPAAVPLLGKLLQFSVRGFRIGRDLENAIEEFCEKAEEHAKQAASQPAPPNPEMIRAQSEAKKVAAQVQQTQMETQSDQQQAAIEAQSARSKAAAEDRQSQSDVRVKELELQIEAMRAQVEKLRAGVDMHAAVMDHHRNVAEQFEPRHGLRVVK